MVLFSLQNFFTDRRFVSKIWGEKMNFTFLLFYSVYDKILILHGLFSIRMRPVINLLSHFASKRQQPTTLLVATTGDTGPAAVHAVGDIANPLLTIVVHYPHGQISDFQR